MHTTMVIAAPHTRHWRLVLVDGVLLTLMGLLLLIGAVTPRAWILEAFVQGLGFFLVLVGAGGMVTAFRLHEVGMRSLLLFLGPFLALLLGFGAIFAPGLAAASAIKVFGALSLASGVFQIIAAVSLPGREHWGLLLINGLLTVGAGIVMLTAPGIAFFVLVIFFGVELVLLGAHRVRAGLRLRRISS